MPSKILRCKCVHEAQDKLHGKGNRVFNAGGKNKETTFTCTVCSSSQENRNVVAPKKK